MGFKPIFIFHNMSLRNVKENCSPRGVAFMTVERSGPSAIGFLGFLTKPRMGKTPQRTNYEFIRICTMRCFHGSIFHNVMLRSVKENYAPGGVVPLPLGLKVFTTKHKLEVFNY